MGRNSTLIWKIEKLQGKQTVETAMEELGIGRQSAVNLISKLKKEGFASVSGGGKQKRIYTISLKRNTEEANGLFTIINKHSKIKVAPKFKHVVHGQYSSEEALIDAIELNDFRVLLASLSLFNHIKSWKKLYQLAKEKECRRILGALYDLARMNMKTRSIPKKTYKLLLDSKDRKTISIYSKKSHFPKIYEKWKIRVPFSESDLEMVR